jgi:hypothetical protein
MSNTVIGIGCPAHMVHSVVQTAADCLTLDLQLIINKMYQHFHIYSVRVEELKSFCEFTGTEYKTVLGHRGQDVSPSYLQYRKLLIFYLH